jgi:succinate dehydrogenase/fumarate reductase cytochrome b subunit
MSVDTTLPFARTGRSDGILDWLQMLTGAGLILFMWSHMILVSSVIIGPGAMNAIAEFFETTYMAQVGGPLIFLVFLFHFFLAARKVPFRMEQQQTISAHARMLRHRDTWLWVVQVVTAMVILMMGSIHHVGRVDRSADSGRKIRRARADRVVAGLLPAPAAPGRVARLHRILPHRREMGLSAQGQQGHGQEDRVHSWPSSSPSGCSRSFAWPR